MTTIKKKIDCHHGISKKKEFILMGIMNKKLCDAIL